jgi:hypothetical protein
VSYSLSKGSFWREELSKGQDEAVKLEVWIRARQDIDVAYCPAHLCLDMARAHNIPDSSVEYLRDSSIQNHRVYLGHLDLFTSLPRRGLGAQDGIDEGGRRRSLDAWQRERGDKRDKSAPQQEGEESSKGRRMGGAGEEAGEVARWCMAAVGGGLLVREREWEASGCPPNIAYLLVYRIRMPHTAGRRRPLGEASWCPPEIAYLISYLFVAYLIRMPDTRVRRSSHVAARNSIRPACEIC